MSRLPRGPGTGSWQLCEPCLRKGGSILEHPPRQTSDQPPSSPFYHRIPPFTRRRFDPRSSPSATAAAPPVPPLAKVSKNPNKNNLPWSWCRTRELRISEIWGWRRRFSPKLSTAAIWYGFQRQPFNVLAAAVSLAVRIPVAYGRPPRPICPSRFIIIDSRG